jgi:hypothetical protein
MKLFALMPLLLSMSSFAFNAEHSLPDGIYEGTGEATDFEGTSVPFTSLLVINHNVLEDSRKWVSGGMGWVMEFTFNDEGNFTVAMEGMAMGKGACVGSVCEYQVSDGGDKSWFEKIEFGDNGSIRREGYGISRGQRMQFNDVLFLKSR